MNSEDPLVPSSSVPGTEHLQGQSSGRVLLPVWVSYSSHDKSNFKAKGLILVYSIKSSCP